MLSLISLLLLTGMQQVLLYFKALNQHELQQQRFYQMERLASFLTQKKRSRACLISAIGAEKVWRRLRTEKGCVLSLSYGRIYYFIEDLGAFPCLIASVAGKEFATHHTRVSLLLLEESQPEQFLQIRYLNPIIAFPCQEEKTKVNLGISSWRYVLK
ncbi:MAG: type II secretion system protein [Legionella sp.]|nr:MAG: type II secretion system protein [Legionella sp.]